MAVHNNWFAPALAESPISHLVRPLVITNVARACVVQQLGETVFKEYKFLFQIFSNLKSNRLSMLTVFFCLILAFKSLIVSLLI